MAGPRSFSKRLLTWFDAHGRHDLPWQRDTSAYAVWISEIMLQQTQVTTVIPYYERFMRRFANVQSLADAQQDEVLAHWSGLGYYARARNMHNAARIVADEHGGELPASVDELVALPGIGRSTAGAIVSIAFGVRAPILDGNVKRVLCRRAGIEQWAGQTAVLKSLWQLADELTPDERVADYTQAIMDLGATLCTRSRPNCAQCPVQSGCVAFAQNAQDRIPVPRPKKARPRRYVRMLVVRDAAGAVLLERRPQAGVWAGLFSLPELPEDITPEDEVARWSAERLGAHVGDLTELPVISHGFTHFELEIQPLLTTLQAPSGSLDRDDRVWYKPGSSQAPGVPAPVSRLLASLHQES